MLPSEPQTNVSNIQRIEPQSKLPSAEVLRGLSAEDIKLLKRTLSGPVEYIANELLDCPEAEQWLMQPIPQANEAPAEPPANADDSGVFHLESENCTPPKLGREHHLFLRLNLCRRRVFQILEQHKGKRLAKAVVEDLLRWERTVQETRSQIVRENVPLVLAMARRTRIIGVDPSDLISEGNLALLRAANKFDCARGYKFSTYACRAILKSFSRVASRTSRYRGHFPTEFDPAMEKSDQIERLRVVVKDDCVDELRTILNDSLDHLSEVERKVILARFALDAPSSAPPRKGKTLEEVGELIGLTKERVRQIQNKALLKLRAALNQAVLA